MTFQTFVCPQCSQVFKCLPEEGWRPVCSHCSRELKAVARTETTATMIEKWLKEHSQAILEKAKAVFEMYADEVDTPIIVEKLT